MRNALRAAALIIIAVTAVAAQGNVTIQSNEPIKVWITNQSTTAGWILNLKGQTPFSTELPSGNYTVALEFPDGTSQSRVLTVRKNCTTRLDIDYKPPTCPTCAPLSATTPTIPETPKTEPEPELKPQTVPTLFDTCCGCKRDDLKARLDLFAIQLHSNPTARGTVVADTEEAINYLVNKRRVDRTRLELQSSFGFKTKCVELWIVP